MATVFRPTQAHVQLRTSARLDRQSARELVQGLMTDHYKERFSAYEPTKRSLIVEALAQSLLDQAEQSGLQHVVPDAGSANLGAPDAQERADLQALLSDPTLPRIEFVNRPPLERAGITRKLAGTVWLRMLRLIGKEDAIVDDTTANAAVGVRG